MMCSEGTLPLVPSRCDLISKVAKVHERKFHESTIE